MAKAAIKKSQINPTLAHSIFNEILYPKVVKKDNNKQDSLLLNNLIRHRVAPNEVFSNIPLVVFDVETTGLSTKHDQIIEIGAIKLINLKPVAEFSSFISFNGKLDAFITKLTGITDAMLKGQPTLQEGITKFLDFTSKSVLVAHNADFDMPMLKAACMRINIDLDLEALCTLKMARQILKELPNRKLDTIAEYYNLTFEERHRSIGDVKVTCDVLKGMLDDRKDLKYWRQFSKFRS